MTNNRKRTCQNCGAEMVGRTDRKFCSSYCKSTYHYYQNKNNEPTFYRKIDDQLKLNRRILKEYNKAGKSVVRCETLLNEGFNPNFFTHYWKNSKGSVYLFCYEFGFMKIEDGNKPKYLLIQWQAYMDK